MATPREIEKLRALDYRVEEIQPAKRSHAGYAHRIVMAGCIHGDSCECLLTSRGHESAWDICLAHASSPEGMVATGMAKIRWLNNHFKDTSDVSIFGGDDPLCPIDERFWATAGRKTFKASSPEAAVHALWLAVP
jgi:hypothetical protein